MIPRRSISLIAATLVATSSSLPSLAAGPFESLSGSWSGTGTVHPQGGSPERIRCNATYRPQGANAVGAQLRCASDSYNFDLSGQISSDGRSLQGQWTEKSRGVGGTVEGTISGDRMLVHIDSAGFAADLGINTRGKQQTVNMESHGAGQVVRGSISMSRR